MEALGRLVNVVPVASGAWINLRDCAGITFVHVGVATNTLTLTQATDVGGSGAANLAVVTRFHYSSGSAGATAWALQTQAAGNVVTIPTSMVVTITHISANSLADTYAFVRGVASSGTLVAIQHDLNVQRDPTYLPAPASSA